jgi:hypothetical protein
MTTKLSTSNLSAETLAAISGPRISNVQITDSAYNTLDDTAANIGGGYIIINGQSFNSAAQVLIDQTPATTITWVSNSLIRAQVPASTDGASKSVYVINPDGSLALLVNGLTYSAFPAWSTGSTLTSFEALVPISIQLSAPTANNYTLAASNTLPSAVTLYANGLIAGTVAANTTTNYNFTVIAKDNENQDTSRSFTLPITQNYEPAWLTVSNLGTFDASSYYSNTLVATDLSNVTYSVAAGSSLPSGLSLAANGFLSGTVSSADTYSFGIVATDIANLSNTRTFSITISVPADTYFKYTTLLLNGETTANSFIADASTTNANLTINSDTKSIIYNPYQGDGYYSAYFDGTGDYLTVPNNTALDFGSSDFTIEFWVYRSGTGDFMPIEKTISGQYGSWYLQLTGSTNILAWYCSSTGSSADMFNNVTVGTIPLYSWTHVAIVRSGSTFTGYINGVGTSLGTSSATIFNSSYVITLGAHNGSSSFYLNGYISNARIVKGTAVYTSAFTPPTSPLTAIANTSLLTCQSNRFIDKSTNNFAITRIGDVSIYPNIPFTAGSSYSTYGSAYFDGVSDTLTTSGKSEFAFAKGDFTIEMWVYPISPLATPTRDVGLFYVEQTNGVVFGFQTGNVAMGTRGVAYDVTTNYSPTSNTWTHLATTRFGANTYIFANGVLVGNATSSGGVANNKDYICTTGLPTIGGNYAGGAGFGYYTGYISDLRVIKGTAAYTTAFTPPTTPVTAVANTSLLTLQYNGDATNYGIIDNSNFNNIIVRNGNASEGTFSPYSATGWSTYFNGTDAYIEHGTTASNFLVTGSSTGITATFEAWVYPKSYNTGDTNYKFSPIHAKGVTYFNFGIRDGAVRFYWYDPSPTAQLVTSASTNDVPLNTWTHVAMTISGTTIKIYINGTLNTTSATFNGISTNAIGGAEQIGYQGAGTAIYFPGYISNYRLSNSVVYSAAFTPPTSPLSTSTTSSTTKLLICQSNRFVDNSTNGFPVTIYGTPYVQAFGPFGSVAESTPLTYSTYFDGTNDYLSTTSSNTPMDFGTGNFTIEGWINTGIKTIDGGASRSIIGNSGTTYKMQLYIDTTNGYLTFGNTGSTYIQGTTGLADSTWHHFAISRSGTSSNQIAMWIDGTRQALGTNSENYASGTIFIGSFDGTQGNWLGYISNLRIVKGTAVYTPSSSTITVPTSSLTAISNTSLLTCQSPYMVDNSGTVVITGKNDAKMVRHNPFGYTAKSTTNYTPSLHGGSVYLDGTGDYLYSPNSANFQFGTGDFTIEFWLYDFVTPSSGSDYIFLDAAAYGNWGIIRSGSSIYWQNYFAGNSVFSIPFTNKTRQWTHIAACRVSGVVYLYVNGVSPSAGNTGDTQDYSGAGNLTIGKNANYGATNGYISDVRITKGFAVYKGNFVPPTQTLTNYSANYPATMLLNFNTGGIVDLHGTNVVETVNNGQLSTAVKKFNNSSMSFDGSSQYLKMLSLPNFEFGTGDFTIESWLYPKSISATASYIFDQRTADSQNVLLAYILPDRTIEIYVNGGVVVSGGTIALNSWSHFAITRASNSLKMFLNGTQIGSTYSLTNTLITSPMYIGTRYNGTQYFNGHMDDFRVTKGVARYTTTFTPPTSSFVTK